MKKTLLFILGIVIIFSLGMLSARFFFGGNEDTWICENNEWIKHGNPSMEMPKEGCGTIEKLEKLEKLPELEPPIPLIKVSTPKENDTISSPLEITGQANGPWYFEGSFPVKLTDKTGSVIATGSAQVIGDTWMTEDLVPFKATLAFDNKDITEGFIVLEKDNPSGLPENAQEIKIPVKFEKQNSETLTIKVFFQNPQENPNIIDCSKVFEVTRVIPKTQSTARAALEELFKGPTTEEKVQGYFSEINSGVKIQKLTIVDGIAKVDFDKRLEEGMGGSCRTATISAQITETLKQFSSIKTVIISIDGRTEDILQP